MKRRVGAYKFATARIRMEINFDEFKDKWIQSVRANGRSML
jgi:hypothetical protein